MTREQWLESGRMNAKRKENATWEIAWWLVEGEVRGFDPGFAASQVILQRSRPTIENYYRVGRAWPRGKNHPDLSFSTHRELLREPDETARALVLCMVLENHWYASDVVRYFDEHPPSGRHLVGLEKESRNPARTKYVVRKRDTYSGSHVKCPCGCEHVFPIKGNKARRDGNAETPRDSRRGEAARPAVHALPGGEAGEVQAEDGAARDA